MFYHKWLCKFSGPLYPLFYESLQEDSYKELKGVFNFLQLQVNESSLVCAVQNQEGNFHRNITASGLSNKTPRSNDLYSEAMLANITTASEHIAECLQRRFGITWPYFSERT